MDNGMDLPLDDEEFMEPPVDEVDEDSMPPLPEDDDLGDPSYLDEPLDESEDDPDDDDLPSPPPSLPVSRTGTFVLPVRKADALLPSKVLPSSKIDLGELSAGLAVREPPQLLKGALAVPKASMAIMSSFPPLPPYATPTSVITDVVVTMDGSQSVATIVKEKVKQRALEQVGPPLSLINPLKTLLGDLAQIRRSCLPPCLSLQGFEMIQGKFDIDPFEKLYVRIERDEKKLTVMIESGEELVFDLTHKAFVFEDTAEPCTIILDYHQNIIIFKFADTESLIGFMKGMPEEVFVAPDVEDMEAVEAAEEKANKGSKTLKRSYSSVLITFDCVWGRERRSLHESQKDGSQTASRHHHDYWPQD
jgi:hypothetical protein